MCVVGGILCIVCNSNNQTEPDHWVVSEEEKMGDYELFQFFTCAYLQISTITEIRVYSLLSRFLKAVSQYDLDFSLSLSYTARHLYYRNAAAKILWGLNTGYKQVDQMNIRLFLTSSNRILHER